jgi:preprotein translocase subunit SecY
MIGFFICIPLCSAGLDLLKQLKRCITLLLCFLEAAAQAGGFKFTLQAMYKSKPHKQTKSPAYDKGCDNP